MAFNAEWAGRATDFIPDLLKTTGKPGRLAAIGRDTLYESLQLIGTQDPQAWVRTVVHGEEDDLEPGLGRLTVSVAVLGDEPAELAIPVEKVEEEPPQRYTEGPLAGARLPNAQQG